jgi:hypothetical protein
MHEKQPLSLLDVMFVQYTATANRKGNEDKGNNEDGNKEINRTKQVAIWQIILDKNRSDTDNRRAIHPISILRRHVNLAPRFVAVPPLLTHSTEKVESCTERYCIAVRHGDMDVEAKRVPSTLSDTAPYWPDFMSIDWIENLKTTISTAVNFALCTGQFQRLFVLSAYVLTSLSTCIEQLISHDTEFS